MDEAEISRLVSEADSISAPVEGSEVGSAVSAESVGIKWDKTWKWNNAGVLSVRNFCAAVWTSRELLWLLSLREFKIRYRQSVIGALWAFIQPLTSLLIFSVLFGLLGRQPADAKAPYWLVVFTGLLPWLFFSSVVQQALLSLVSNQHLITKVRFPRQLLPLSSLFTSSVDFGVSCIPLTIGVLWNGLPGPSVFLAPLFLLLILVMTVALALGISALNALYRDVSQVIPLMMQVLFYSSAVVYQVSALVPERYRWIWSLNPLVTGIEGFRWSLLGTTLPSAGSLIWAVGFAMTFLWFTCRYFRHVERILADRI